MPDDSSLFDLARLLGIDMTPPKDPGDLEDGLRLVTALVAIRDPEKRAKLIELAEEMARNQT
jgi:hypothetical protein